MEEATAAIGPEVNRGIHDLSFFSQLFLGYGDADLNAGGVSPIQIISYAGLEAEATVDPSRPVKREYIDTA